MPETIQKPEEKGSSLAGIGSSLESAPQEKLKAERPLKYRINNYLKSLEEMEADFRATSPVAQVRIEQGNFFIRVNTSDNLDGYIHKENPGVNYSGFMEENY